MAGGRAETYDQRADLLGGMLTRNRIVGVLRILVPALGLLAFAGLAGQIYIANMLRQYGVSGISIDRGNIVVEAPQYSGTGTDGSRYLVTAREARTPIGQGNRIDMIDADLEFLQASGNAYFARAAAASMDTGTEMVTATGPVAIRGSDGLVGTLTDVKVDNRAELVTSHGAVDLLLPDGTTIVSDNMVHDGKAQLWTFERATVIVPDLPGPVPEIAATIP